MYASEITKKCIDFRALSGFSWESCNTLYYSDAKYSNKIGWI